MTHSDRKGKLSVLLIVLVGTLTLSNISFAAPSDYSAPSVRQLLTQCLNDSSYLYSTAPSCELYISGFISAIKQFEVGDQFCSGDNGLEISLIRQEFVNWAIYHSEEYDAAAADALNSVMKTLYPCNN